MLNKKALFFCAPYYLLIACLSLIFLAGMFKPGYLTHQDTPSHHYEYDFMVKKLLPSNGWINGWCRQDFLGYPILLYRPQLGLWFAAILNKIPGVSLIDSYKIMVLFTLLFLCCSVFYLVFSYFGRTAAIFASLIVMLQKDIYFDKLLAGMWENFLAIGIFLIFFKLLYDYYESLTLKRSVILGLLLALITFAHLFVAIFAFMLLFIVFLIGCKREAAHGSKAAYFLVIPATGIIVSLFYTYPFWETGGYLRSVAIPKSLPVALSWTIKGFFGGFERFFYVGQIVNGEYLLFIKDFLKSSLINIPIFARDLFGIYGAFLFIKELKTDYPIKRFLSIVGLFTILALLLYSDLLFIIPLWKRLPFISTLQTHRFLVYAHLGLLVFAAYGVSRFFRRINGIKKQVLILLIALFTVSFVTHRNTYIVAGTETFDEIPESRDLKDLWTWVSKNIDANDSRIVYQNTNGNSKSPILSHSNIFSLAGLFNDVSQIGGFMGATPYPTEVFTRTDNGSIFGKYLPYIKDEEIYERMKDCNSQFIVSCEDNLKNMLYDSDFFEHIRDFGDFSVFKIKDFTPAWFSFRDSGTDFGLLRFEEQFLDVTVNNSDADNWARFKGAFHPYWRAEIDGEGVDIDMDEYGMTKIYLRKTGNIRLRLYYDSKTPGLITISLVSLFLALCILIIPEKKNA